MFGIKKLDIAELRAALRGNDQGLSCSRDRNLAKMITGHIEQHSVELPNGLRASGACEISGVIALTQACGYRTAERR